MKAFRGIAVVSMLVGVPSMAGAFKSVEHLTMSAMGIREGISCLWGIGVVDTRN